MQTKPTDLNPVDERLLELQDEVRDHFGWGLQADVDSALALVASVDDLEIESWSKPWRAKTVASLHRRLVLRDTKVAILGAAITTDEIEQVLESNCLMIAADGSSGVLDKLPNSVSERAWSRLVCIVSDADGGDGTIAAVKRGVPVILHAHGDNLESWSELLELASSQRSPPPIVLTHQTPESIEGMHNPGGFTDGDRAVCFARALGVERDNILLLGTRTDIVGEWSGTTNPKRKLVKLQWMAEVLQHLGFLV